LRAYVRAPIFEAVSADPGGAVAILPGKEREPAMKTFVCAFGALLVLAGGALQATAQTQTTQPKTIVKKEPAAQPTPVPRGDRYREQTADKLPVGSQAWWDQMAREGRFGGEHP
jgi:hypothetical protein